MFRAKIRKIFKKSSENENFYSRKILLYIAWARLRNEEHILRMSCSFGYLHVLGNLSILILVNSHFGFDVRI